MNERTPYFKLASTLVEIGYTIKAESHTPAYSFWRLENGFTVVGMCTPNDGISYTSLNGKIAADNIKCFDKWTKCPLVVNVDDLNLEELLKHLDFLGSAEGYKHSNSYEYLDTRILPRVLC